MEFNASTALLTASISSVVGFGLAFFIGKKISLGMEKKSQKLLVSVGVLSLGVGLTAILNELVGFPLQGLKIRYDKVIIYLVVNIFLLPLVFIGIAKMLRSKSIQDTDKQENSAGLRVSKTTLFFITGAGLASLFLFLQFSKSQSDYIYDFYYKTNYKDCNSSFDSKPFIASKFVVKAASSEVFWTYEIDIDGVKKHAITKLTDCAVIDDKRWTCKGDIPNPALNQSFTMMDGDLSFSDGIASCPVKVIRR